ncbi:MAG: pilus assembly protein PilM [Fibrobacteria bacterium]
MMFERKDSVLALDIGTAGVKGVEVNLDRGRPILRKAAVRELHYSGEGERGGQRPEALPRLMAAVSDLLAELGVRPGKARRLVTCLPGPKVSIKQIKCLALPEAEMRSALVFEARKHLPVEGDVLMDYQLLNRRGEEQDVLLVVTTKQAVNAHLALLEACGLKGGVLEAPSLALWNAFLRQHPAYSGPGSSALAAAGTIATEGQTAPLPVGCIDIGATSTGLSFFHLPGLYLTRDIAIAGDRFTEDMRQNQGSDFPTAEKAKTAGGLFKDAPSKGSTVMTLELEGEGGKGQPSLQTLVREIQRSIRYYLKEAGQAKLEGLMLAGGSAADAGLREHLQKELGLSVKPLDPVEGWEGAELIPASARPRFAQAVGMALRGAHEFFPHQP